MAELVEPKDDVGAADEEETDVVLILEAEEDDGRDDVLGVIATFIAAVDVLEADEGLIVGDFLNTFLLLSLVA